jgi:hypothetical protein
MLPIGLNPNRARGAREANETWSTLSWTSVSGTAHGDPPRPTCAGAAREPALPARSRASGKRSGRGV